MKKKGLTKKDLEEIFPHLSQEIQNKTHSLSIDSVRSEARSDNSLRRYDPDVIDYLRRCTIEQEGIEIINFLEKQGEINSEHATKLRKQLKEQGIRSFGAKKERNYYFKRWWIE